MISQEGEVQIRDVVEVLLHDCMPRPGDDDEFAVFQAGTQWGGSRNVRYAIRLPPNT